MSGSPPKVSTKDSTDAPGCLLDFQGSRTDAATLPTQIRIQSCETAFCWRNFREGRRST
jgi:hypothetical protein